MSFPRLSHISLIWLAAVGCTASPVTAVAQPPTTITSATLVAAAFATADRNSDQKLDRMELSFLPKAIRDRAVDANHDGFYTLNELQYPAIVSVGCYLVQTVYLFWSSKPADLAPDEIALQIDVSQPKPVFGDPDLWTYDVKHVISGSYAPMTVTVRLAAPLGSCTRGELLEGADIVAGRLEEEGSQGSVLKSRSMPWRFAR